MRKSGFIAYFGITLSALALSSVALGAAPAALASSPAGRAVPGAPARADSLSAVAGYAWINNGSPEDRFAYDSADSSPGAVTVGCSTNGVCEVFFAGMSGIAKKAVPQVTAFETNEACVIAGWGSSAGAFDVTVECSSQASGSSSTSLASFEVVVTHPVRVPHGTFDYSYVDKASSSGTLANFQYNSAHKKNSVKHLGTGRYQVTLGGPKTRGTRGVAMVSAHAGSTPGRCELVSWKGSSAGELVDVDCFGTGDVRQNRAFIVTYTTEDSLLGIDGQTVASAFDDSSKAVQQPPDQFDSAKGARITVVRYSTGFYQAVAAGSAGDKSKYGGDVQISAVGGNGDWCVSDGWDEEFTPTMDVECFNSSGKLVNAHFTIEWVVPAG